MTTARQAGLVTCRTCARVWPMQTESCGRCGMPLTSREPMSLQRVWAWWLAGLVCYIPANLYPMLVTETLTSRSDDTIIGGAIEIARHGDLGIALIVLIASVFIPVIKFIAIGYLALSVRMRSQKTPVARMHLFEVIEFIGRWSMIDVFVVAILSALVQLSVVASIQPGPAALAFALSVIFTMFSAKSFDPRLIWDYLPSRAGQGAS
ncbi:paraquat-inducible protein A [Vannielia litorea]|uniref:paraquat-inducible protein A n=1 Tax=Vannielia litorea TaxID=1217970 RepID=UPI001BCB7A46|nr:paraquat-inducible protein A [Vannielia litorea]MBS8225146.1 paraquat-inducible membrane protein A [Vannielia litorea]